MSDDPSIPRESEIAAAAPTSEAARRIRREWKGELGRPVFRVQFGVGFGARQPLAHLLAEIADFGGGATPARNPALRVLRAALDAGGAIAAPAAESIATALIADDGPGDAVPAGYRNRPSIVPPRGRVARSTKRPPTRGGSPPSWPAVLRDLVEHQVLLPEGARLVVNPRIALQLAAGMDRLATDWRQVTGRTWTGDLLTYERGGRPGESHALRDLVARLFEFAGVARGEDRHACWALCRRLVDAPRGDSSVLIFGLPAEVEVAPAIERLQHVGLLDVDPSGGYRFGAPEAAHARFAETVRFLEGFVGAEREEKE